MRASSKAGPKRFDVTDNLGTEYEIVGEGGGRSACSEKRGIPVGLPNPDEWIGADEITQVDQSLRQTRHGSVVIRGDKRVADLYLTEFMRLFNHYRLRAKAKSPKTRRHLDMKPRPAPTQLAASGHRQWG